MKNDKRGNSELKGLGISISQKPGQSDFVIESSKSNTEKSVKNKINQGKFSYEDKILQERKDKILSYIKRNFAWITYVLLAIIVLITVRIRTRNLSLLRDVTNNAWTLGPDADPWLFARLAKYIVEHGSIMDIDTMRYVPIGFEVKRELILHPYLIAWFHNISTLFGSTSVEQSAAIYPVFFFSLTIIAFFFLVRKFFIHDLGKGKSNAIALIASFFLAVIPIVLPRTVAGIPEKESAAFFFIFLSFYLFLCSWKSDKNLSRYGYALAAGLITAAAALIWGGFIFIFVTLGLATLISFFFGQIDLKKYYVYSIWLFSSLIVMSLFSVRYSPRGIAASIMIGVAILSFLVIGVDFLIRNTRLRRLSSTSFFSKIPKGVFSLIAAILIIAVVTTILFGFNFVPSKITGLYYTLFKTTIARLDITVQENQQPYFVEWSRDLGPMFYGVSIFFWIYFIGAIYLFLYMIREFNKKEKWILTSAFTIFLLSISFSRYSKESILNGINFISIFIYVAGIAILITTFALYYLRKHESMAGKLREIDFGLILFFSFFFLTIIGARGAVRLIMLLVPPTSIIVGFFIVKVISRVKEINNGRKKTFFIILSIVLIIGAVFTGFLSYQRSSLTVSTILAPTPYNQQWQYAMSWVRENTQKDAVFAHWWDYGYWVQSIGERPTVLDGGNAVGGWNHLMGRHVLTGNDERKALEFLYAHNTSYFLIDSTDLGKYNAFSSIGSDENYDRRSAITAFLRDDKQTQESEAGVLFGYLGGKYLDEDIIYEKNGEKIFLPGEKAGIAAIIVPVDAQANLLQPIGVFFHNNKRYNLELRYAFRDGELKDFGTGIEAGVYLMPRVTRTASGEALIDKDGVVLFLDKRVLNTQFVNLYLYNKESPYFNLVHREDDLLVKEIRSQIPGFNGDLVYFDGIKGPIKIWKISYPSDIEFKEEYLSTKYVNPAIEVI